MKRIIIFSILIAAISSCKKSVVEDGNTVFSIRLTDAPAVVYDSVIVDVQGVEVKGDKFGTIILNTNKGLYNLLDYANGKDTLIARDTIAATKISQIRLILGSNNYVIVGGTRYNLSTPSAQQSGLKLNVHETLVPNSNYALKLDFDANQSIVTEGNGGYSLKPVIKVITSPI